MKHGLTNKKRTLLFACFLFLVAALSVIDCRMQYPNRITIFEGEQITSSTNSAYTLSKPTSLYGVLTDTGNVKADAYTRNMTLNEDGDYNLTVKLFGIIPVRTVTVDIQPETKLFACGNTVGVKIFTKGLVCVGTQEIKTINGRHRNISRELDIRSGDVFLTMNGEELTETEQISHHIKSSGGNKLHCTILRNGETITKEVTPLETEDGYKLGIWLRDSTAGIGTLTFYNPQNKTFGALGHPITDADTNTIMPVSEGALLPAKVLNIEKGKKGEPGELKGLFNTNAPTLGTVTQNTQQGIFGHLKNEPSSCRIYPAASGSQIKEGEATILANISGETIEEFSIEIQKNLSFYAGDSKDMIIHVTDPKLIEKTGGIVQGMSGSPILQNGRIVGAVTHVFVNDPTRGYGIFIENMLKEADN